MIQEEWHLSQPQLLLKITLGKRLLPPPSYLVVMSRISIEHVAVVLGRHKNRLMLEAGSSVVDGFDVEKLHIKFLEAAYGAWPVYGQAGTSLNQMEIDYLSALKNKLPDVSKLEVRQIGKITQAISKKFDDSKKSGEEKLNPKTQKTFDKKNYRKTK